MLKYFSLSLFVFILSLIILAAGGYIFFQKYKTQLLWENTEAIIAEPTMVVSTNPMSQTNEYVLKVRYVYTYQDQSYESEYRTPRTLDAGEITLYSRTYQRNSPIYIKVNPADPSQSALRERISYFHVFLLGIAVVFVIFSGAKFFWQKSSTITQPKFMNNS